LVDKKKGWVEIFSFTRIAGGIGPNYTGLGAREVLKKPLFKRA